MSQQDNINKVKSGEMTHLEYLQNSKEFESYKNWCRSHCVEMDERSAEFYFDQTIIPEYDESEIEFEIYP